MTGSIIDKSVAARVCRSPGLRTTRPRRRHPLPLRSRPPRTALLRQERPRLRPTRNDPANQLRHAEITAGRPRRRTTPPTRPRPPPWTLAPPTHPQPADRHHRSAPRSRRRPRRQRLRPHRTGTATAILERRHHVKLHIESSTRRSIESRRIGQRPSLLRLHTTRLIRRQQLRVRSTRTRQAVSVRRTEGGDAVRG